jgi:hypothetical protein
MAQEVTTRANKIKKTFDSELAFDTLAVRKVKNERTKNLLHRS